MSKEIFESLIEIESIARMIQNESNCISSNIKRLNLISTQKSDREEQVNNNKEIISVNIKNISDLEKELSQYELTLKQAKSHLLEVSSLKEEKVLNNEIKIFSEKSDIIENEVLTIMEINDTKNNEIKEDLVFISGITKTFIDIKNEVDSEKLMHEKEILRLEKRIDLMLDQMPSSVTNIFNLVSKKQLNALSFIKNNTCGECYTLVDMSSIAKINKYSLPLELCLNCGRILIPSK